VTTTPMPAAVAAAYLPARRVMALLEARLERVVCG
jgi:hypothetical protein